MRQNKILAEDVDLEELAALSKNFTGAEIVGLINSATSFALNRHIKVGSSVEVSRDASNMRVSREDFVRALDEVHAAYGVDEDEFASCGQEDVAIYSDEMRTLVSQAALVIKQAEGSARTTLSGILFHGSTGSGKTALCAKLATESDYPFIKLLSTHTLVGLSEAAKVGAITKLFMDAYKSQLSLIVVDDIEDLIEFVSIGPRFSTSLLQTLRNFFKKAPPEGRRLVILATTRNRRLMDQLGISQHFRTILHVPNVATLDDFRTLLYRNQTLVEEQQAEILQEVQRVVGRGSSFSIPVKTLQDLLDIAAQDMENAALCFMDDFGPYIINQDNSLNAIDDIINNIADHQQ